MYTEAPPPQPESAPEAPAEPQAEPAEQAPETTQTQPSPQPDQTPEPDQPDKPENSDKTESVREMKKAAYKKFEEAAAARKEAQAQVQQIVEALQSGDPNVYRQLFQAGGVDFDEIAERVTYDRLMAEKLTPEQKQQREWEIQKQQFESEKSQWEQQRFAEEQQRYEQQFLDEFSSALESAGLPVNTWTVSELARLQQVANESGKPLRAKDLVEDLTENWREVHSSTWSGLEGDALLEAVGEDLLERIREADLARFRKGQSQQQNGQSGAPVAALSPPPPEGSTFESAMEWALRTS